MCVTWRKIRHAGRRNNIRASKVDISIASQHRGTSHTDAVECLQPRSRLQKEQNAVKEGVLVSQRKCRLAIDDQREMWFSGPQAKP
jgi:hypothetical protein